MKKVYCLVLFFLILFPFSAMGAGKESKRGKDIAAEWYFPEWLGTSPLFAGLLRCEIRSINTGDMPH